MKKKLSEVISVYRKDLGYTQMELAKEAGVGKTVIYDIEHGKQTIKWKTLLKIFHTLNIRIILETSYLGNKDHIAIEK